MVRKNILSTFLFLYFSPAAIWDNKSICNKTLPCKLYVFDRYTAYYTVKKQDEMFGNNFENSFKVFVVLLRC